MEEKFNIEHINADVISIFDLTSKIGWKKIKELSILRILYLSSILFSFRFPDESNPFETDYEFTIDSRGPYNDMVVNNSIVWLLSNEFIRQVDGKKIYSVISYDITFIEQIPNYSLKKKWLEVVVNILGIYGEDNIYDFIFRDPEYQDNLNRQSTKPLNIGDDNKTIETLKNFQSAFEEALGDKANNLSDKDYLEMYFEFIFSKYLRGEK